MLHYWYSTRCSRPFKMACCIVVFAVFYFANQHAQLDIYSSLIALGLGASMHLLYQYALKHRQQRSDLQEQNLNTSSPLRDYLAYLPALFCGVIAVVHLHMQPQFSFLLIQLLCLYLLGFFLFSVYSQRSRRAENLD